MRRQHHDEDPEKAGGTLLVAHPSLLDPNFKQTVLFLPSNLQKDGSYGLVLNRPTDKCVEEVLGGENLGSLGEIPIFLGGPVGMNELIFTSLQWRTDLNQMIFRHHLPLDEAKEIALIAPERLRAFVGYAGWTRGQLDMELSQKAWLYHDPFLGAADLDLVPELWHTIMRQLGPWFHLHATIPDNPSLN